MTYQRERSIACPKKQCKAHTGSHATTLEAEQNRYKHKKKKFNMFVKVTMYNIIFYAKLVRLKLTKYMEYFLTKLA